MKLLTICYQNYATPTKNPGRIWLWRHHLLSKKKKKKKYVMLMPFIFQHKLNFASTPSLFFFFLGGGGRGDVFSKAFWCFICWRLSVISPTLKRAFTFNLVFISINVCGVSSNFKSNRFVQFGQPQVAPPNFSSDLWYGC